MKFDETLSRLRTEAFEYGEFILLIDESINTVVRREHVSEGYGIYVISGCRKEKREIIYIGKAGTVCQDGSMLQQGIRKRLTMKQDSVYRNRYFPEKMHEFGFDALHFKWLVTYRDGSGTLPFFAEAELIFEYFSGSRCLPLLNKDA